jgi:sporulation protein YlmC with PRC-barrel domain
MRLADLYGKKVRGPDGESLGRVHEVRSKDGKVVALDCGPGSVIERFAARRGGRTVKWEQVKRITRDEILLGGEKGGGPKRRGRA